MIKKAFNDTIGSAQDVYLDMDKVRKAISGYERDKQILRYSYIGECFIKYAITAAGGVKQFKEDLLKYACINYYDGYASNKENYDYIMKHRDATRWEHIYAVNGSKCFFFDPVTTYKGEYNYLTCMFNSPIIRKRLERIHWCASDAGVLYPYEVMILLSYLATVDLFRNSSAKLSAKETVHKEYIEKVLDIMIPNGLDNVIYAGPVYAKDDKAETRYAYNIKFEALINLDIWFSNYYTDVIAPANTDIANVIMDDDKSMENLFNGINDEEI